MNGYWKPKSMHPVSFITRDEGG